MRKNKWFKMGAGLTAALMLCGSVSVVAFADEADAAAPAAEETVAEEVVTEEVAEEEVADIGDIVIEGVGDAADSDVAPEQEIKRISSEEEEVSLAADSVNGDGIVIGDIAVTHGGDEDPYYTVKVPYTYSGGEENADITIFAYDITSIIAGNPDAGAETEYSVDTPVGWVNQEDMAASGTLTFKVSKISETGAQLAADDNIAAFDKDSTILIKVGGTGIETPAAKIFSFANAEEVQGFQGTYGDPSGDGNVDSDDAYAVLQHFAENEMLEGDNFTAADVDGSGELDSDDAYLILQFFSENIDHFPVEE